MSRAGAGNGINLENGINSGNRINSENRKTKINIKPIKTLLPLYNSNNQSTKPPIQQVMLGGSKVVKAKRCIAKTLKGTRCKHRTTRKSGKCASH